MLKHIHDHVSTPATGYFPDGAIYFHSSIHSQFGLPASRCVALLIHTHKITKFLTHDSLTTASKLSSHLVHVIILIECKE